jgi:hypothetical protein
MLLVPFCRHDFERDALQIIAEEYNSLVDTRVHPGPMAFDDLKSAVFDDVQRPLA